jgi:hypothetical protein
VVGLGASSLQKIVALVKPRVWFSYQSETDTGVTPASPAVLPVVIPELLIKRIVDVVNPA